MRRFPGCNWGCSRPGKAGTPESLESAQLQGCAPTVAKPASDAASLWDAQQLDWRFSCAGGAVAEQHEPCVASSPEAALSCDSEPQHEQPGAVSLTPEEHVRPEAQIHAACAANVDAAKLTATSRLNTRRAGPMWHLDFITLSIPRRQ